MGFSLSGGNPFSGGLEDIFGGVNDLLDPLTKSKESTIDFKTVPQTPEAIEARKRLFEFGTGERDLPTRGVAGLPEQTSERKLARETAAALAQPIDILQLPEVQGVIAKATEEGNLMLNRIGRALQLSGSFTATPGRDVLGRAVTGVSERLTAQLAPFLEAERGRRERLIPQLESLGLTEEERVRLTEQAELDAEFQRESQIIPLLRSILGEQPDIIPLITGGGPSTLQQLTQAAAAVAPIAAAASDEKLKDDIETITDALDKIEQIEGKTFKFKEDGRLSGGVIAQDVQKIMPDMVTVQDDYLVVDYTAIVGLLVNAVKELKRKVEENGNISGT